MKIYSFSRGGIKYEDHSVPPRDDYTTAFLPSLSVLPLIQHSGSKAYPVVTSGERVSEGMLIGRGQGRGSANVHATVPGRVLRFVSWKAADDTVNEALVIHLAGSFEKLGRREEVFPWTSLSAPEIQRVISQYGIVEMEGSGIPVSDLIAARRGRDSHLSVVVRCVFDDPWLAADYVLVHEKLDRIAEGSVITARAAMADRIVFVVSQGEEELAARFTEKAGSFGIPVNIMVVGDRYPQHNQRELEYALRQFEKKEGLELGGFLTLGPATLAAVFDAVKLKKPILERYVAVGGSAVKKPRVLKVRIGTRIGELFDQCGGFAGIPGCIATGSPLSGKPVANLDEPVIKTSFAVFALLEKHRSSLPGAGCIGCGECRAVCPVGLDPEALYKASKLGMVMAGPMGACHSCGCCDLVCPSRIALSSSIRDMAGREQS
ncbi:MAG: SLBB domain-containing protein [Spirochaetaceae bacterium]|jgi:electron transport complex protein RnfC|nr:SLBB domain-containing protein [Spirochaetaceae bacterium]